MHCHWQLRELHIGPDLYLAKFDSKFACARSAPKFFKICLPGGGSAAAGACSTQYAHVALTARQDHGHTRTRSRPTVSAPLPHRAPPPRPRVDPDETFPIDIGDTSPHDKQVWSVEQGCWRPK